MKATWIGRTLGHLVVLGTALACGQGAAPTGGTPVVGARDHLTTPVAGLERTQATAQVVAAKGPGFEQALKVMIAATSPDTNVTQLTLMNKTSIAKGDVLLASMAVRGATTGGKPARAMFLFERSSDPWTKSVSSPLEAQANASEWRQSWVAFQSSESYAPGQAMASIRLAFGPQTIEIGGFQLVNFGKSRTLADLQRFAIASNPLGAVDVRVDAAKTQQTMRGFGGNFCQPRYGSAEPMDAVGRYTLANLNVVHARVGVPLEVWTPERGVFKDEGAARASLLQLQLFALRGTQTVASVWEGPAWMLPGNREQNGKVLPKDRYDDCIEAIAQYLVKARDQYGANVDYFSFNEPDYGVNFRFTGETMRDFIAKAGPRFEALGLKTKFLVSDSANGANLVAHALPILQDPSVARFLGPIAFHCWDALTASDEAYAGIAELGVRFNKEVWCLEAGHDAALWQAENPWASWDNALKTALAYSRTIRLTRATLMDYWTYQDNYPLVSKDGATAYAVFEVLRQMEAVFAPGSKVVSVETKSRDLSAIATSGPDPGRRSVLLVNPIGKGSAVVSGLPASVNATVTLQVENAKLATRSVKTDAGGRLTVDLPAQSVVIVRVG